MRKPLRYALLMDEPAGLSVPDSREVWEGWVWVTLSFIKHERNKLS